MDNINYELSQSTKPKIGYVGDNEYSKSFEIQTSE